MWRSIFFKYGTLLCLCGSILHGPLPYVAHAVIIGDETGRIISNNPKNTEAKLAEATGFATACGREGGSVFLITYKKQVYLIGSAHGFYRSGQLKCKDAKGKVFLDQQYDGNPTFETYKSYFFNLSPLNEKSALKTKSSTIFESKQRDFVIFGGVDDDIKRSQNGTLRPVLELSELGRDDLIKLQDVTMISSRENFHNTVKVSIEIDCRIRRYLGSPLMRHSCDTGKGSSGAPLLWMNESGKNYVIGIHIAGRDATEEEFLNDTTVVGNELVLGGNYFIPSYLILEEFERLERIGVIN